MRGRDGGAAGVRALAGMLCLAAATTAAAGSFSISPIRVDLSRAQRSDFFTLHNDDDAPVVVQLRAVTWSQLDGEEQYADSRDLLTTPPVFEIAPKGSQIVRVALRRDVDAAHELSYRLFFQEVPPASARIENGLSVALRLSVPVFVQPVSSAAPQLQWQLRELEHGALQIEVCNLGTAHQRITDFDLRFDDGRSTHVDGTRYVLPGSRVHWAINLPGSAHPTGAVAVHGFSDGGEFSAEVTRIGS